MQHEIVIQVREDIAAELIDRRPFDDATKELLRTADELHVELVPQHAGTKDSELATFFSIVVSDATSAQQISQQFAKCQGVHAAYAKPQGGPP